jgi:cytochrome c553
MYRKLTVVVVTLVFALAGMFYFHPEPAAAPDQSKLVERGRYLVTMAGCNDCHSPKVITPTGPAPDESRLLSGHIAGKALPPLDRSQIEAGWVLLNSDFTAFAGPWGITYAANLTPDDQTGIGLWKLENFENALRTGKHMGLGRPIRPPMPWPNLTNLSEDDYAAMFAYLKSLPPIKNQVPANKSMEEIETSQK